MKKLKYLSWLLCAMCVSFVSCDKDKDNEDSDTPSSIDVTLLRCERVGQVLQIDYKLTNVTKENQEISIHDPKVMGSDGTNFNYTTHAFGNAYYYEEDVSGCKVSLAPRESAIYHIKVSNFSYPTSLKSVDVSFDFGQYGSNVYTQKNIRVTDNRVMSNGVQTNDVNLDYQVTSCQVDDNGYLILNFTVKNNTGMNLEKVRLCGGSGCLDAKVQDNKGTTYDSWAWHWGSSDWEGWFGATVDIPQSAKVNGSIRVENFDHTASSVTIYINNEPSNYRVADYLVRFITIPVQ